MMQKGKIRVLHPVNSLVIGDGMTQNYKAKLQLFSQSLQCKAVYQVQGG